MVLWLCTDCLIHRKHMVKYFRVKYIDICNLPSDCSEKPLNDRAKANMAKC